MVNDHVETSATSRSTPQTVTSITATLDGLDDRQHESVTSNGNPLAILAGAGSGKTRVLTRRIAYQVTQGRVDPQRAVAVTFTRKAASELRSRLSALGLRDGPTTGTFHSLAYAQLRERWAQRKTRPPQILDRRFSLIAQLLGGRAETAHVLDTMAELDWLAARDLKLDAYQVEADRHGRANAIPAETIRDIAVRYGEEKRRARVVDFNDLLKLAIRDIESDPEYAQVVRWRMRHIFVDEFQDVNPLQFRLMRAWAGDEPELCVVGDPNQSIYGWNGADSVYLRHFTKHFTGASVVKLAHNYRSTPQIIALGHRVLPKPGRDSAPPRTNRTSGIEPHIIGYPDDQAEADGIARSIRDHSPPGSTWSTQAVLVRTNAQVAIIANSLERAGIPHRTRGQAPLIEQAEIRELLKQIRKSDRPLSESIPDLRIAVFQNRLSPRDATNDEAAVPQVEGAGGQMLSLSEAERQRNREALLQLASEHASASPSSTGADFVSLLTATARRESFDASKNGVDVMTFHASKGLEWPVVHLAGVEMGLVPISQARGPAALSEERRLLHVAITRARNKLLISWAAKRKFGERTSTRQPSPYIAEPDEAAQIEGPHPKTGTTSSRSRIKEIRAELEKNAPADDLYRTLVGWRRQRAQDRGVPAYVIFNNKTLSAIAGARPSSIEELLRLPGIGESRAESFGIEILELVRRDT